MKLVHNSDEMPRYNAILNSLLIYKHVNFHLFIQYLGPAAPAQKYIGGEHRHDLVGNTAYVAIAADCTGATIKEMVAANVLASILGMQDISKVVSV